MDRQGQPALAMAAGDGWWTDDDGVLRETDGRWLHDLAMVAGSGHRRLGVQRETDG